MQFAIASGSGTDDKGAVGNGVGYGLELRGLLEKLGGTDGGASLAKRCVEGIHDAQMAETEIAHRTCSGADVQRIAGSDENHAKMIEI